MSDIVERLRDRSLVAEQDGEPLALLDDAADEIARLHGVNDRLRAEIERLRTMVFRPVTLTDAEREAVATAARIAGAVGESDIKAALRGLLERLGGGL